MGSEKTSPVKDLFRQGVVAVITAAKGSAEVGQLLLFERKDHPDSWQFPQGGIEGKESPEQALLRELKEEIGTNQVQILIKAPKTTFYRWRKKESRFVGQEHHWFLCQFDSGIEPLLHKADHSFLSYKWVWPDEVVSQTVEWKRSSISLGLQYLNLVGSEL